MVTKMRDNEVIRLQIPGEMRYVSVARQAVEAVTEQLQLPGDARMAVKLAVGEACNNAVQHARRDEQRDGSVMVACRALPDALEIDVTNQGNGFHPPVRAAMPESADLLEHGRGMALMEMMMDSVEYLSENGDTTVRMRKRRPVAEPTAQFPEAA